MKLLRMTLEPAPEVVDLDHIREGVRRMKRAIAISDAVDCLCGLDDARLYRTLELLRAGRLVAPTSTEQREDDRAELLVGEGEEHPNLGELGVVRVRH